MRTADEGKQRADDCQAFGAAIIADYEAQSAVERTDPPASERV
jgi:hypothetical protein